MTRHPLPRGLGGGLLLGLIVLALWRALPQYAANVSLSEQDHFAPSAPPASRQQLFERLGAGAWHKAGHRGQGVKVAILDSGFRGYRKFLGNILPANIQVKSFRADGDLEARDSQHGILCAEVVHALAPEAELLFVTWEPDRPDQFLAAVRWAKNNGARVLSCSLIMPSWSDGNGGGSVNDELARLLGDGTKPGDLSLFASAGNTAQRHWQGHLHPNGDNLHQWRDGRTSNTLTPWGEERVSVEVYGQASLAGELIVLESGTGRRIGSAFPREIDSQPGRACAVVRFHPEAGKNYQVILRCGQQAQNAPFHLVILGGNLDLTTAGGSIAFPADCPAAVAVGAVDLEGQRLPYSSCGPNSSLPKPDFVAEVPFPSQWRERPFAGTSAAAPQAAALAALLLSRHPDWTPRQVGEVMKHAAKDLGPAGHDCETGYGRIALP